MKSIHAWSRSKYFIPVASCFISNGYLRSIIIDCQRGVFHFIPHSMALIFEDYKGYSVREIFKDACLSEDTLSEYFDFMQLNELAIWCEKDEVDLFSSINKTYETPYNIACASMHISERLTYSLEHTFMLLSKINCQHISIISDATRTLMFWRNIADFAKFSSIKSIQLMTPYTQNISISDFEQLMQYNPRIFSIDLFRSPISKEIFLDNGRAISMVKGEIDLDFQGSLADISQFSCDLSLVIENMKYNSYHNKKLFIRNTGEITNAANKHSFGLLDNIDDVSQLKLILGNKQFTEHWDKPRTLFDICKHCEFKLICTDSRMPRQRGDNEYFFDSECNYNPFIAKWKGEVNYKTLIECGIISNQYKCQINSTEIQRINTILWD